MKIFWFLILTICLATAESIKSCREVKIEQEKNCQKADPGNYVQCVKTRMKRQSRNCKYDDRCFDCDCESCQYSQCNGQCNDCCNSCCTNYVQCHSNHCCHKQCHSECRTYNCRSSCRKSCYESIPQEERQENEIIGNYERGVDRTIIGSGSSVNNNVRSNTSNTNVHNITTVINLKNVINNTNLIDVPINLNYTNRNNISLSEAINAQGGARSGDLTNDDCCIVIGPRQCVPIQVNPFVRCFYLKSRQCGSFCTTGIVHKESTSCPINAYGQPVCEQEAAYIPQPQPKCSYSRTWPYVVCGVQPPASCEGCYGHYFNSQTKEYKSCSPQCYNDFGTGPLYRQGPFYQPTYSHMPPCNLTPQGCGGVGGFGMMGQYGQGFGGYMGGLSPGFGGGFGYGPQLPMVQPGLSFQQPQFLGDSNFEYSKTFLNSSELLDGMAIDSYQDVMNSSFVPIYELPEKEVSIDVTVTDPQQRQFKQSFRRDIKKESNDMEETNVIIV